MTARRLPLPENMTPEQMKVMASKMRKFVYWNRILIDKAEAAAIAMEDGDLMVAQMLTLECQRMLDKNDADYVL